MSSEFGGERDPGDGQPEIEQAFPMSLWVNNRHYELRVDGFCSLLSLLRRDLGLTGTKEGCDDSECGACIVLVDDKPVNSCSYLALQCDGRAVTTVEALSSPNRLSALQERLLEAGGVQCGFCTPGMLMAATALLTENACPSEHEVQVALAGNLCRCTGYRPIVAAVLAASTDLRRNERRVG